MAERRDGPSLETYLETRLNLLDQRLRDDRAALDLMLAERDQRYEERYRASEQALVKVATSMDARFQSVNEFRSTLADQARDLMPRAETEVRMKALETVLERLQGERIGVKGGWGYAVGAVGFVLILVNLWMAAQRLP